MAEHVVITDESGEPNPYLLGVYAPVQDELTAGELTVIGRIPTDLNGVYLRNGPNARYPVQGRYHWFDGDGMVHAMHFENGTARYRNRWVRTRAFEAESAAGHSLFTGVMESPKGNPFGNARGLPFKDTANTDVIFHRGRVLASWYLCGSPYGLDPLSLETLGADTFLDTLNGDFMAHPKVDEATGELFWFDYGPRAPYLRYGVVGASGAVEHCVELDLPGARLPHDMGITENYAILMDLPLYQDLEAARQGRYKLTFDRELPARFGVIPRRGTEVRWFEAKPCYIYHVVNAWEEGEEIVMDVCRVSRPAPSGTGSPLSRMISYLKLDARMYRYRFDLRTGRTSEAYTDPDHNTEFPSIDARATGRPTRYAYNVSVADAETNLFDGLVRYDNRTGGKETYSFGPGVYGSEAPFAPRDGSTGEDDGYLVTFVTDERENRSEVQILDASRISDGPVARILLPQRVPLGFHATWVREDQLR
ncbi:carotenoid oxygenase family protein [Nonomuraea sp. NBC_01738]|uniref:carotenoid oxygenase family protein n=1 Tax=Nonomuraea sp. NBC_01738 TaxID=2976003 RepID=UPI002E10E6F8|nr:carotenoid oxygenase family protein [Nonomuraea sp. NBC_01738]